jgi:hypothetical protein
MSSIILNPMFDSTFAQSCVAMSGNVDNKSCKLPIDIPGMKSLNNPNLFNLSSIPGPSIWVPSTNKLSPNCVIINDNAVCLHYTDISEQITYKVPPIISQTFTSVVMGEAEKKKMWIQNYGSNQPSFNLMSNPTTLSSPIGNSYTTILSSDKPIESSIKFNHENINNNSNDIKYIKINEQDDLNNNNLIIPYNDTSTIAPQCVIITDQCTVSNPIDNCNISCPTIDESQKLNYIYNKKYNLWLDPYVNTDLIQKVESDITSLHPVQTLDKQVNIDQPVQQI